MDNQYRIVSCQNGWVVVDHPQIDTNRMRRLVINLASLAIILVPIAYALIGWLQMYRIMITYRNGAQSTCLVQADNEGEALMSVSPLMRMYKLITVYLVKIG